MKNTIAFPEPIYFERSENVPGGKDFNIDDLLGQKHPTFQREWLDMLKCIDCRKKVHVSITFEQEE